jgi:hypothetical protein
MEVFRDDYGIDYGCHLLRHASRDEGKCCRNRRRCAEFDGVTGLESAFDLIFVGSDLGGTYKSLFDVDRYEDSN